MQADSSIPKLTGPVLLYDGDCGLCNAGVRWLLRWDRQGSLRFSALQNAPAQAYLQARGLPTKDFDSLIFVPGDPGTAPLFRTDGVLGALREIGGVGRWFAPLRFIPRRWRDLIYRFVAQLRYRVFGEYVPRPLARSEWKQRFIPPLE